MFVDKHVPILGDSCQWALLKHCTHLFAFQTAAWPGSCGTFRCLYWGTIYLFKGGLKDLLFPFPRPSSLTRLREALQSWNLLNMTTIYSQVPTLTQVSTVLTAVQITTRSEILEFFYLCYLHYLLWGNFDFENGVTCSAVVTISPEGTITRKRRNDQNPYRN